MHRSGWPLSEVSPEALSTRAPGLGFRIGAGRRCHRPVRGFRRTATNLSPLTIGKFGKKESAGLGAQNRRMLVVMRTTVQTASDALQLTLVATLLMACLTNLALVWVWL